MQITTHDKNFNIDDITAVALIRLFLNDDVNVIRTSNEEHIISVLDNSTHFVLSVGNDYDIHHHNFDYHQDKELLSTAMMIAVYLRVNDYINKKDYKYVESLLVLIGEYINSNSDLFNYNEVLFDTLPDVIASYNMDSIYGFDNAVTFMMQYITNLITWNNNLKKQMTNGNI